jgi:hypothetical protein
MAGRTRREFLRDALAAAAGALLLPGRALAARRRVDVICRNAWDARDPSGRFRRHRIRRITVHHSAAVLRDNRDAPDQVRSMQRDHQDRGWPDIAYHLLIDRHGNVYAGRPRWAVGDTATDYDPRGHLLVLCLGHFDRQSPSKAQVRALSDVLAWGCHRYNVRPGTIAGHRDYASTACPGRRLYRLVEDGTLARRVRRRLQARGPDLDRLCGRAGRRRVRRIERGTD